VVAKLLKIVDRTVTKAVFKNLLELQISFIMKNKNHNLKKERKRNKCFYTCAAFNTLFIAYHNWSVDNTPDLEGENYLSPSFDIKLTRFALA
jgi:hypothetical protein